MSPENTQEPNGRSDPEEAVLALRKKARAALSDAEVLLERGHRKRGHGDPRRGRRGRLPALRLARLGGGLLLSPGGD